MKSNYLYLLFICVISCLFVSCSDEDNKGEEIPEWNRFRTTNVLVYAHLSEQNLFSSCSYKEVASSIRNTVHSVALLDRTNAVYGQTAIINTGTETARESKKVPVFVPVSYSNGEKKIIGSTVLFPSTISPSTAILSPAYDTTISPFFISSIVTFFSFPSIFIVASLGVI